MSDDQIRETDPLADPAANPTASPIASPAERPRRRLTRKEKLALVVFGSCVGFVFVELGFRVIYAFRIGPSMLLYGTSYQRNIVEESRRIEHPSAATEGTDEVVVGYTKYHAHQSLKTPDPDTAEGLEVTINNHGFRGRDFEIQKPPGTLRVVTLGASSTFGFHDRDDETYPHQLEQLLNAEKTRTETFEVINLAIPHMTSSQVLAVFLVEGLPLDPDVVTLYTGHNDVHALKDAPRRRAAWLPALHDLLTGLAEYLVTAAKINSMMKGSLAGFTEHDLKPTSAASVKLIANIARIHEECAKRGIRFLPTTQQKRSMMIPRSDLEGVTYEQEVALVREKLQETGLLTAREFGFLAHDRFMTDVVAWSKRSGVGLVDVVSAMDTNRQEIVSPVHLSAAGNAIVARALADEILGHH